MSNFALSLTNAIDYAASRKLIRGSEEVQAELLPGGVSCTVIRLLPKRGEPIVIKQALEKLNVAAGLRSAR